MIGGASGALIGGVVDGIIATSKGMDFWDGDIPLEERAKIISRKYISQEQWNEAKLSDVKIGSNLGDANGRTTMGKRFTLPNGESGFQDNTIELSRTTIRRIWNNKIQGFETLKHELQHSVDFANGTYSQIWGYFNNKTSNISELSECVMEVRAFNMSYQRTGISIYKEMSNSWYDKFLNLLIP